MLGGTKSTALSVKDYYFLEFSFVSFKLKSCFHPYVWQNWNIKKMNRFPANEFFGYCSVPGYGRIWQWPVLTTFSCGFLGLSVRAPKTARTGAEALSAVGKPRKLFGVCCCQVSISGILRISSPGPGFFGLGILIRISIEWQTGDWTGDVLLLNTPLVGALMQSS